MKIPYFVILALIGLLLYLYLSDSHKEEISALRAQDEAARATIDSLSREYATLSRRDSILWEQITASQDSVKAIAIKAKKYRKKYESLKNRPVPRLSDGQLDSVLSKFR